MTKNKNEVIHQHTVPVCYLANFGVQGNQGRNSSVFFVDKTSGKKGCSGVEAFPVEKRFYDLAGCDEHKQIIEKFFSMTEGELATLLRELILAVVNNPNERNVQQVLISAEQRNKIAAQIAMITTRTRAFREEYKSSYQQIKDGLPFADIPQYEKADFQRLHNTEILSFGMSNFYANLFDDRNWVFLINHTSIPFITSDNPSIMIDNRKEKEFPISPVADEATWYFPISPTIAIEIYSKAVLKTNMSYFDVYQERNVKWYNRQIFDYCTRFAFSNKSFIHEN